jgi:protein SCO1/2
MKPERSMRHALGALLLTLLLSVPLTAAGHEAHNAVEATQGNKESGQNLLTVTKQPEVVDPAEWVQEKTGAYIPLDAVFKSDRGETVTLQQLVDRPTLLLPVYYSCPKSCSFDLANLADAVRRTTQAIGSFRVISMSFNVDETPQLAASVKPNYMQLLSKDFPENDWAFLTGDADNILKVTRAIGYSFKRKDDATFIHPSAMAVLDQDGRIIKYVYGSFIPGDVDLALSEAAKGTPATSIRRFLAFCFSTNPRQNQQVFTILKLGTISILAIGAVFFFIFLRRKKTKPPNT